VIVEGKVRADKRAPGGYELDVANVQVIQRVPIPIPPHHAERARHRLSHGAPPSVGALPAAGRNSARARRDHQAARDYLDQNGFTLTDPPIITPAACEGTSTLFPVDYSKSSVPDPSGQLYAEATAMALGKVYSFGPTFRAEKSKTRGI